MPKFTDEQQAAIDAKGKTIVSASAGSGKTTVMIEKILGILKSGVDVSQILAVTYTKKAAAQMREKLRGKIVKELAEGNLTPELRAHLKKQLAGVAVSDVSTIHSFCSRLIKTHFYAADVGSNFSVISAEDSDGKVLQARAIDEIFETAYDGEEQEFYLLLSVYYRKKKDAQLREILTKTYNAIRSRDDYLEYLKKSEVLNESVFDEICAKLFQNYSARLNGVRAIVNEAERYFTAQKELEDERYEQECSLRISQGKKPLKRREKKGSLPRVTAAQEYLLCAKNAKNLFELAKIQMKFPNKESGEFAPDYREQVEKLAYAVSEIKTVADKLAKLGSLEEEKEALRNATAISRALAKYLLQFDEIYKNLKREKGVLDYNDLEHIALYLLNQEDIAAEMREKYKYVFVDEYQDVNPVQEKIIRRVCGENVFLVGDMKQAIYAFRGSKSIYFKNTWDEYKATEGCNALQLPHNFRSRLPILQAVNGQFVLSMTDEFCGIDYQNEGKMQESPVYSTPKDYEGYVRVHFFKKAEKEETDEELGVYSVREATAKGVKKDTTTLTQVVNVVKSVRGNKFYDNEIDGVREVKYGDIAILTRWNVGRTSQLAAALAEAGIPVVSESPVNIFEFAEIQTLTDILRLIDNAEQDIPLCSALLSAVGGLTENELAKIRLAYPLNDYYFFRNACKEYAAQKSDGVAAKLRAFFAYLQDLRRQAHLTPAGELLVKVLAETGLEASLIAAHGGKSCLGRINRFLAETQAQDGMSVREFLERLKMLEYKITYSDGGGEDCVKIMSMHASKGLEFPIVIVDDLGKSFHAVDSAPVMPEEEYGLAPYAYDSDKMLVRNTVHRIFNYERKLSERAKDELNLYYVALTRAKYGLHLFFDKKEETLSNIFYASSMQGLTDFEVWKDLIEKEDGVELPVEDRQVIACEADEGLKALLLKALAWEYGSSGCEDMPVKNSATALLRRMGEGAEAIPVRRLGAKTGLEEGLAYHAFLEDWDFSFDGDLMPAVKEKLAQMREGNEKEREYAEILHAEKLVEILSLPVFKRLKGKTLYKERKFLAAIPAKEVLALQGKVCNGSEELLIQGAIDLLVEGDGEWEIVDYKYSARGADELREHYALQLALYKKAVAKIQRVDESAVRCTIVNIYEGFELQV